MESNWQSLSIDQVNNMPKTLIGIVFCLILSSSSVTAQEGATNTSTSVGDNPLVLVDRFIDAFYPKLSRSGGEITLRTSHMAGGGVLISDVRSEFRVCLSLGSGVPVSGERRSAPPSCASRPEPDLVMQVAFDSIAGHPPMTSVFVTEMTAFRKQHELLSFGTPLTEKSLEKLNAKFVPSRREEFLAIIPVERIEEFSGCLLDRGTARFVSESERIRWVVEGVRKFSGTTKCRAEIDPFEGGLMSIS